ncbi:MAG: hypothetical protein M1819_005490 [Sarea resinae]|nr:MAG: hypothetical protein M1819_005490 [Sarea resinae]
MPRVFAGYGGVMGLVFLGARFAAVVCEIVILGLTAHFLHEYLDVYDTSVPKTIWLILIMDILTLLWSIYTVLISLKTLPGHLVWILCIELFFGFFAGEIGASLIGPMNGVSCHAGKLGGISGWLPDKNHLKANCYEMQAVWGMEWTLAGLFGLSAMSMFAAIDARMHNKGDMIPE